MSNLKIAYADVGFNSARILTQNQITTPTIYTLDSLSNAWDLVAGHRYYRTFLSAVNSYAYYIFDLGADYAAKQNLVDHFIIARGDLADIVLSGSVCNLHGSADGNSWDAIDSVGYASVAGPRSNDFIKTFTQVGPYRYYRAQWARVSGTSIYQHSKCYIGKFFNFAYDCDYKFSKVPLKKSAWYSSAGAQYFARNDEPLYKFDFTWQHVSDALVKSFEDSIVKYARDCPVFLYTSAQHQILDNKGLVHAHLTKYKAQKVHNDYNTITASFEEELG
jgi:hypothetical protein